MKFDWSMQFIQGMCHELRIYWPDCLAEVKTVATTIIIISNHWQNNNWFWTWIGFIMPHQIGMFLFIRAHLLGGKRKLIQHISFPRNMCSSISQSQLYFIEYLMNSNTNVNNLISIVCRYAWFQGFLSAQQIDNFEFIHSKMIFYRFFFCVIHSKLLLSILSPTSIMIKFYCKTKYSSIIHFKLDRSALHFHSINAEWAGNTSVYGTKYTSS